MLDQQERFTPKGLNLKYVGSSDAKLAHECIVSGRFISAGIHQPRVTAMSLKLDRAIED